LENDGDTATGDALWSSWRELPDKQRQAVALHHVAGLPYAEVATLLGGSAAAARRAAADGIATLRRRYPSARNPQQTRPTR
jgi:DNA-directed RNA polymerase specialized sigma24 family protein